jgi:hypothetical protein
MRRPFSYSSQHSAETTELELQQEQRLRLVQQLQQEQRLRLVRQLQQEQRLRLVPWQLQQEQRLRLVPWQLVVLVLLLEPQARHNQPERKSKLRTELKSQTSS